jgi:hypothetical protein
MRNNGINQAISWMKNNKFWISVIIFFLLSVSIILVFNSLALFSFMTWLPWRIFDYAKYPLTASLSIYKGLWQLCVGSIGDGLATLTITITGLFLYPLKFLGELLQQIGSAKYDEAFAYALSFYAVIGGLIWSITAKKKGLTLIFIGSVYSFSALVGLIMVLAKITGGDLSGGLIVIAIFVIISAICWYLGTRRFEHQ